MSQALSLKCNICGVQLKSVAEAQQHGEATGHADFSESTEAVLNLQCKICGKPCRSETEKDLHTKRTGHTEFEDRTNESAKAVDTEEEMKQLETEMKEELGLPVKAKGVSDDDKGKGPAEEGGDTEMTDAPPEMVEPEVDQAALDELATMGFPRNRCVRALYETGTSSVEQAVNWIVEHGEDEGIDEPLLVPKGGEPKKKLTKEEARAKAEELRKQMAAKKEKEEKEMERLREQERIRSGKELLKAKKQEEELQLKRNLEARRIEKEEEARAKEKIRAKLEEDRKERRRKLGLPEELTEEEKERERQREAEKAAKAKEEAEKKAAAGLIVKPVTKIEAMRAVLVDIKKCNPGKDEEVTTCFKTLLLYLGNVAKNPDEEKYRTIKLTNAAYLKRVGSMGGQPFLEKVGFTLGEGPEGPVLTLARGDVDMVLINSAGGELNSAISNPFFGVL